MSDKSSKTLKAVYTEYLSTLSIGSLRSIGRKSGVSKSTLKKKDELIKDIVAVLSGEVPPIEKSNRGAPVKDDFIDPKILGKLEEIKLTHLMNFSEKTEKREETQETPEKPLQRNVLMVADPTYEHESIKKVYSGQFDVVNGIACLLPFNGKDLNSEKVVVPKDKVEAYDFQEGDIVCCYTEERHSTCFAGEILSINGISTVGMHFVRLPFEELEVCFPRERIVFYNEEASAATPLKAIDWLIPIGKGQRVLISSEPKAGKTALLKKLAESLSVNDSNMRLLILSVDQTPETVNELKEFVTDSDFVRTTYDDDFEKHIFAANFLLKRAKQLAGSGANVVLLVDSFEAIARAYFETINGNTGISYTHFPDGKTIRFMRRFFGAARCFEKGGSLTIIGTSCVCGSRSSDDVLTGELARIANCEIVLDGKLTRKRNAPAIDLERSMTKESELLLSEREALAEHAIRNDYLIRYGNEATLKKLDSLKNSDELYNETMHANKNEAL